MVDFHIIIPARHDSIRLPGKPLLKVAGRPLIWHVYQRAVESGATTVTVATDDQRIADACDSFGAEVLMTSTDHQSGTDRIAECVEKLGLEDEAIVVNLQGDEPLTPAPALSDVAMNLADRPGVEMATLCTRIEEASELHSPHAVKVVQDADGYALYFSRAPVPWHRDQFASNPGSLPDDSAYFRHIGVYAYRVAFLKRFTRLTPAPWELVERLEQLRALYHGARIHVAVCEHRFPPGVDTPEDLERVARALA